jgi:hypothetical protein
MLNELKEIWITVFLILRFALHFRFIQLLRRCASCIPDSRFEFRKSAVSVGPLSSKRTLGSRNNCRYVDLHSTLVLAVITL